MSYNISAIIGGVYGNTEWKFKSNSEAEEGFHWNTGFWRLDPEKLFLRRQDRFHQGVVGELIREGSSKIKETFESLLVGETITTTLDEQIVYNQGLQILRYVNM